MSWKAHVPRPNSAVTTTATVRPASHARPGILVASQAPSREIAPIAHLVALVRADATFEKGVLVERDDEHTPPTATNQEGISKLPDTPITSHD